MPATNPDRFWSKVDRRSADECWPWKGGQTVGGYGKVQIKGRTCIAHRAAYEFTHGPIPHEDLEGNRVLVCHRCDTPLCCNPAHLRLGTSAENQGEMADRGRSMKGERNGQTSLTAEAVREIRRRYGVGERQVDLAAAFGVHQGTVSNIVRGKTWSHA